MVVAATTNASSPTGGNTSPMATISIDITPNHSGSNPSDVISGNVSGSVISSSGTSSMNMLMMK